MSAELTLLAVGGPIAGVFAAAAGIAAAVLVLGGPIMLRSQRQRHQFLLTKAAIEKGVTRLPAGPPAWLQSARTGVILLTLGVAIFICGFVSFGASRNAKVPAARAATTQPMMPAEVRGPINNDANRPMDEGPPPEERMGPGSRGRGAMGEGRGLDRRPEPPQMDRDDRPLPPPPPPVDPEMERWHQAQAERAVGLTGLACGFILAVMGLSRLLFSRIERRYEPISTETTSTL